MTMSPPTAIRSRLPPVRRRPAPARSRPPLSPAPSSHRRERRRRTTRDADSPKSAAAAFNAASRATCAPTIETSAPVPLVSKQHSASVTARPPSEQSCADRIRRSSASVTSSVCKARYGLQIQRGRDAAHQIVHDLQIFAPAQFSTGFAEQNDRIAGLLKNADRPRGRHVRADRQRRWSASGRFALPSVSLYRLTLPPVIGTSSARHAAPIPSTAFANWPHDGRTLRVAEVEAVGRGERSRAGAGDVARRLGHREHRAAGRDRGSSSGRCRRLTLPVRDRYP